MDRKKVASRIGELEVMLSDLKETVEEIVASEVLAKGSEVLRDGFVDIQRLLDEVKCELSSVSEFDMAVSRLVRVVNTFRRGSDGRLLKSFNPETDPSLTVAKYALAVAVALDEKPSAESLHGHDEEDHRLSGPAPGSDA